MVLLVLLLWLDEPASELVERVENQRYVGKTWTHTRCSVTTHQGRRVFFLEEVSRTEGQGSSMTERKIAPFADIISVEVVRGNPTKDGREHYLVLRYYSRDSGLTYEDGQENKRVPTGFQFGAYGEGRALKIKHMLQTQMAAVAGKDP